jgi:hypothetical protein
MRQRVSQIGNLDLVFGGGHNDARTSAKGRVGDSGVALFG